MSTDNDSSGEDSEQEIKDTPPQRVTRSKMRQPPQKGCGTAYKPESSVPTAGASRVTRSKIRVVDKPKITTEDGEDDDGTPTAGIQGFLAPNTPATVVKAKPIGYV